VALEFRPRLDRRARRLTVRFSGAEQRIIMRVEPGA
jgi:hypothetical protein